MYGGFEILFFRKQPAVLCLAVVALCIVVARACIQSITIDESASYLLYAGASWPSHWYPANANHVLNSILMRLATSLFGISELTVRMPAILGAAIYIAAAVYLCVLLTERKLLQIPLFICLVYNPFVLDYLVAARGYSLAVGFLLAGIAVIASTMLREDETRLQKKCVLGSILLALSFASNFSFAIVDGMTMLVFFGWAAKRKISARLLVSCFLPGITVALVICGSVLREWPKGQFVFGAESVSEMRQSLMDATFDELNPSIVNPLLLQSFDRGEKVLRFISVFALLFLVITALRGSHDSVLTLTRLLVTIAALTFLWHWLAFRTVHLLLPKYRTGLFFIPLLTLAFGGALGSKRTGAVGYTGIGVLIAVACCFVGCLRLGFFKEWKFNEDTKHLYWLADDLHRRCGVVDFCIDWRYHVTFNFYREAYRNVSVKEFEGSSSGELPENKDAYVIFLPTSEEFIQRQGLKVIYHNDESGSAVAVRAGTCGR